MSSASPHTHFAFSIQRLKTARRPPRVWELALVIAVFLSLGVLVTRTAVSTLLFDLPWLRPVAPVHEQALQPASQRSTIPELIAALKDPDPYVRLTAVQTLGWQRAAEATDAILEATYDPDAQVREEAAAALGEIGQLQALPRLLVLQAVDDNPNIQLAAFEAEDQLTGHLAAGLSVPRSAVQAWAIAPNGAAYVAVSDDLYVLDHGAWKRVRRLPAAPKGLALGPTGQLIYMTTASDGLYRSLDGGMTWDQASLSGNTPNALKVTAAAIDPKDAQTIYLALAAGTGNASTGPLGVISSHDGGKTWRLLKSPLDAETQRLILDPTTPGYLYGLTNGGSYRIALTDRPSGAKFD